jgi:hypothetical protein
LADYTNTSAQPSVENGLPIQIYFEDAEVSFAEMVAVLDVVDREFRRMQDGILALAPYFGSFNEIIVDASRQRLRQSSRQSVRLSAFQAGSLVVGGTLAFIVLGILKNTIGESLKQGWQESELHDDLVAFTRSSLNLALRETRSIPGAFQKAFAKHMPHVMVRQDEPSDMISIRVGRRRDGAA